MTTHLQTSKSFDENGIQTAWNSSSIKLAETCLRKYGLTMIEGWTAKSGSVHLRFGAAYATALEHYHKHIAHGLPHDEALRLIVREAMVNTWEHELDDEGNAIPGTGRPEIFDHPAKTRENLVRTIVWYLEHFAEDPAPVVILSDNTPAVELTFALEVDDGNLFTGHLDRLVTYGDHQYVMDQKTTGSTITARFFEQFKPDTQMSMYTFAGQMLLQAPIRGVIIDGAQIAVNFSRFERGFTFRTESELNEWYDSALYHIEQAKRATRENFFPMNTASCGNYGGCVFRNICGRAPGIREQFLRSDFQQVGIFDPMENR